MGVQFTLRLCPLPRDGGRSSRLASACPTMFPVEYPRDLSKKRLSLTCPNTHRHTKPGGWVEFVDLDMRLYSSDGTLSEDDPLSKWNRDIIKGAKLIGREPNPGPLLAGLLKDAGFVSVTEEVYPLPIGTWPKDNSLVCVQFLLQLVTTRDLSDQRTNIVSAPTEASWGFQSPPIARRSRSLHARPVHSGSGMLRRGSPCLTGIR